MEGYNTTKFSVFCPHCDEVTCSRFCSTAAIANGRAGGLRKCDKCGKAYHFGVTIDAKLETWLEEKKT